MPFSQHPCLETLKSISNVSFTPFWMDDPSKPTAVSALTSDASADLAIIGAGFTGLWAAYLAKEADPSRDIILIEAGEAASGASGRNGGFMEPSVTHGFENGRSRWPKEISLLTAMSNANLDSIQATVERLNIGCDFLRPGELLVATEPYQVQALKSAQKDAAQYGEKLVWLEREQVLQRVNSPTYLGALMDSNVAMVNPAQLAWGLRKACIDLGVRYYEHTPATAVEDHGKYVSIKTPFGRVRAGKVALATNAFPPLLKHISNYMVPVYDYVLVTEPLNASQRSEIGWQSREGIADIGNQFHYYRTTVDGRILWGGYDSVYYPNNGFGPHLETNADSFGRLAEHFFETFPQLQGLQFTHAWGGAIDTCSRFNVFWGTAHAGRTAYALGYTGLGVGASRFGAQVLLDLLDGKKNERTRLKMVRTKPIPFPPEPYRSLVIKMTQYSLDMADHNEGHRNLWLKLLDALGLGFDS
jgi:glycine/D-amino acid oxidase-like deaminating enzyme